MQLQGIDPFIEISYNELPSDATNLRDLLHIDKIYGNVIDGISIPGVRLKADGTIKYEGDSMLAQASYQTNTQSYQRSLSFIDQAFRGRDSQDAYGMHDTTYSITQSDQTLAGGTLANANLITAVAAKKFAVAWVGLSWDTDPAVAYTMAFHENGSATILWRLAWTPTQIGEIKFVLVDTATANKNFEADIDGGAGAEALIVKCNYSPF